MDQVLVDRRRLVIDSLRHFRLVGGQIRRRSVGSDGHGQRHTHGNEFRRIGVRIDV